MGVLPKMKMHLETDGIDLCESQEKDMLNEWKRKTKQNKVIGICGYNLVENILSLHWITENSFISQMTIILNCIWQ